MPELVAQPLRRRLLVLVPFPGGDEALDQIGGSAGVLLPAEDVVGDLVGQLAIGTLALAVASPRWHLVQDYGLIRYCSHMQPLRRHRFGEIKPDQRFPAAQDPQPHPFYSISFL